MMNDSMLFICALFRSAFRIPLFCMLGSIAMPFMIGCDDSGSLGRSMSVACEDSPWIGTVPVPIECVKVNIDRDPSIQFQCFEFVVPGVSYEHVDSRGGELVLKVTDVDGLLHFVHIYPMDRTLQWDFVWDDVDLVVPKNYSASTKHELGLTNSSGIFEMVLALDLCAVSKQAMPDVQRDFLSELVDMKARYPELRKGASWRRDDVIIGVVWHAAHQDLEGDGWAIRSTLVHRTRQVFVQFVVQSQSTEAAIKFAEALVCSAAEVSG